VTNASPFRSCRACNWRHDPMLSCARARLIATALAKPAKPTVVVRNDTETVVVHSAPRAEPEGNGSSLAASKHGVYADKDKRRAYRRAWMRRRREQAKQASAGGATEFPQDGERGGYYFAEGRCRVHAGFRAWAPPVPAMTTRFPRTNTPLQKLAQT